jgi:hypothetical protein
MDNQQPSAKAAPTHITTIVLSREHIPFLDEICANIRRHTGFAAKRSALIRALIEGFSRSGVTITNPRTEQEMANALAACLRRGADRR